MARQDHLQTSFTSGVWSSLMGGRIDLQGYTRALARCHNMVVLRQGPATRRPGTIFVRESRSTGAVRLLPFEAARDRPYVLECGPGYLRVHADRATVVTGRGTPVDVATSLTELQIPYLQHARMGDTMVITRGVAPPCSGRAL